MVNICTNFLIITCFPNQLIHTTFAVLALMFSCIYVSLKMFILLDCHTKVLVTHSYWDISQDFFWLLHVHFFNETARLKDAVFSGNLGRRYLDSSWNFMRKRSHSHSSRLDLEEVCPFSVTVYAVQELLWTGSQSQETPGSGGVPNAIPVHHRPQILQVIQRYQFT